MNREQLENAERRRLLLGEIEIKRCDIRVLKRNIRESFIQRKQYELRLAQLNKFLEDLEMERPLPAIHPFFLDLMEENNSVSTLTLSSDSGIASVSIHSNNSNRNENESVVSDEEVDGEETD